LHELDSGSQVFSNIRSYLKSAAYDYWATIGVVFACLAVVFGIQDGSPLMALRYFMGSLLVIGLPGYSFVAVLWPKTTASRAEKGRLDWVLRFAFSIVLSIVTVSIVVSILNLVPFGVTFLSVSLSLSLLTIFFATLAMYRNYRKQKTI